VLPFQDAAPTPAGDWRHIVRFGRNVASYKFSLGQALLELAAQQQTFVPLPELAVPYAAALCEHLKVEDRQSTSAQSQFLDVCRSRNRGDLDAAQLAEATVRLGSARLRQRHRRLPRQPRRAAHPDPLLRRRAGQPPGHHADRPPARVGQRPAGQGPAARGRRRWNLVQLSRGLRLGTRLMSTVLNRCTLTRRCSATNARRSAGETHGSRQPRCPPTRAVGQGRSG
jgi:hypothetical protein